MIETAIDYHALGEDSTSSADRILELCYAGQIAEARRLLVGGGDPESLLARGVVYYWLASTGSEISIEEAKDILAKAQRLFLEIENTERALLCQTFVGLCYWRQGQSAEAMILIGSAGQEAASPRVQYLALISKAVLQTEHTAWREALRTLEALAPLMDAETNLSLKGRFHHHRGLAYKQGNDEEGGHLDQALIEYEAAIDYYERAGNARYEARILNNLAMLYLSIDPRRAHANIDCAIRLLQAQGERAELAQARDTRALIYLAEGHLKSAKSSADQAVALQRISDDQTWLPSFLITRARIFARMNLLSLARRDFAEAVTLAETAGNGEMAASAYSIAIEELADYLPLGDLIVMFVRINDLAGSKYTNAGVRVLQRVKATSASSLAELELSEHQQESEIFREALGQSKGSITKAAKALGIARNTLSYKIKTRHPELAGALKPTRRNRKCFSK